MQPEVRQFQIFHDEQPCRQDKEFQFFSFKRYYISFKASAHKPSDIKSNDSS